MLEALFAGHRGKGVVDTCLQIELAVFLLQFFGDEDDVDTGETLVQESDGLAKIKGFEGATGKFEFDANRDPKMDLDVLQVKEGKWVPFA